jgi:hypothetical protein
MSSIFFRFVIQLVNSIYVFRIKFPMYMTFFTAGWLE